MNVRKAGLWTGGILLFLILAAFVAVRVLVDPQHLREMARDKVRKHLSRELTLADVKLEFSPLPSIHAVDVAITGKDEPAIKAAALIADLELLPLLMGQAKYRTVYVKDATIERGGSTWRIEEGTVESGPDLHDVKIAASLWRNRKPVALVAQFDDLSNMGKAGQATKNPNLAAQGQDEKIAGKIQRKVGQIEKVFEK